MILVTLAGLLEVNSTKDLILHDSLYRLSFLGAYKDLQGFEKGTHTSGTSLYGSRGEVALQEDACKSLRKI